MFLHMPAMGFGQGSGVLAGQNLGAGKPERAERSGWIAAGLAEGLMLVFSVVVLLWAENIIRLFNSEPEVVAMSALFLRIAAAGFILFGFYFVLQHGISGAGDTLPPMLITLLNFWMLQIPLAYLLPKYTNLGVLGVRWAIAIGVIVASVAYAVYFKIGRWKLKKV